MKITIKGIEIEVPDGAKIEIGDDGTKIKVTGIVEERIRVVEVPGPETIRIVEVPAQAAPVYDPPKWSPWHPAPHPTPWRSPYDHTWIASPTYTTTGGFPGLLGNCTSKSSCIM